MKQLAFVQIFHLAGAVLHVDVLRADNSYHVFGARNAGDPRFALGQEWDGNSFAIYSVVCFIIAFLLSEACGRHQPQDRARNLAHLWWSGSRVCLLHPGQVGVAGNDGWSGHCLGLNSFDALRDPLSGALPAARMGVYMGIFNFFIVIPEIVASLFFGRIIRAIFGENSTVAPLYMVIAGGVFMLIAAALVTLVTDVVIAMCREQP